MASKDVGMARNGVNICQPPGQLYSEPIGQQCSKTSRSKRRPARKPDDNPDVTAGEKPTPTTKPRTFLSFVSGHQSCQFITLAVIGTGWKR